MAEHGIRKVVVVDLMALRDSLKCEIYINQLSMALDSILIYSIDLSSSCSCSSFILIPHPLIHKKYIRYNDVQPTVNSFLSAH